MEITLPYNYKPRDYQLPFLKAMDEGTRYAVLVWPRRSGKDKTCINFVAKEMMKRKGIYYYVFPTYAQGKKAIWQNIDKEGFKTLDHFPKQLVKKKNDSEMLIEYVNNSIFQVIGSDNYNHIVGTNPVGMVYSEYALQDPQVWAYMRPILAENDGWAVFNFTPRGQNHGFDIYELARKSDDWFCDKLTVEDTKSISPKALAREKAEYYKLYGDNGLFMQEFYTDFQVPVQGAYYASQINQAIEDGRITNVPYDHNTPVNTYWDLGIGDNMAIWFVQNVSKEIHLIDYYENSGKGIEHYIKHLKNLPYIYRDHYAPHDIQSRELGTGKSRWETARDLGIRFKIVRKLPVDDGIQAARSIFNKCWFDLKKTKKGVDALRSYTRAYDEKNKRYKDTPLHDWSSDAADAFRYFAVAHRESQPSALKDISNRIFHMPNPRIR